MGSGAKGSGMDFTVGGAPSASPDIPGVLPSNLTNDRDQMAQNVLGVQSGVGKSNGQLGGIMQGIGQGLKEGLEKRDQEQAAIRANARPVQFQIDQPQLPADFFQQSGYLNNAMQRFAPMNPMRKFDPFYGG